jgi:hypothetical protein
MPTAPLDPTSIAERGGVLLGEASVDDDAGSARTRRPVFV